jgi:hypothetical protein
VVTRGGLVPKMLHPNVVRGAANVASLRRLRHLVHGAIALRRLSKNAAADTPTGNVDLEQSVRARNEMTKRLQRRRQTELGSLHNDQGAALLPGNPCFKCLVVEQMIWFNTTHSFAWAMLSLGGCDESGYWALLLLQSADDESFYTNHPGRMALLLLLHAGSKNLQKIHPETSGWQLL